MSEISNDFQSVHESYVLKDGEEKADLQYVVYLLYSLDKKRTYVGITNNLTKRLRQHNQEIKGGSRATKCSKQWKVLAYAKGHNKSSALSTENKIKHTKPRACGWCKRLARLYQYNLADNVIVDKNILSLC